MSRELYSYNLMRKYGRSIEHQTPLANRITDLKRRMLKQGLPIELEIGVVDVNDRGDLIIKYKNGGTGHFVDVKDELLK